MTQTAEVDVPPAKEISRRPEPAQRLVPGWISTALVVFAVTVIVMARFFSGTFQGIFFDEAVSNLATLIAGAVAVFGIRIGALGWPDRPRLGGRPRLLRGLLLPRRRHARSGLHRRDDLQRRPAVRRADRGARQAGLTQPVTCEL